MKSLKIDFRTKGFMTLVIPTCLVLGNLPGKNLLAAMLVSFLPCVLMLISGQVKSGLQGLLMISLGVLAQRFLFDQGIGLLNGFILFFVMIVLRMLPGLLMGKYTFQTTDMSEIVFGLKKLHFPDQMIIPVTVMARFFYTTTLDYNQIKDALYIDGLTTKRLLLHPLKFFEYRVVPLLMVLTRTADDVSVSALTRGLEVGQERTYIFTNKMKLIDYLFIASMFLLIFITWGGNFYA